MIKKHLFERKSLKWQLLIRLFTLLIFLLIIMEVFQYIFLKRYLCRSSEQLLEVRLHNVVSTLASINSTEDLTSNASYLTENTADKGINSAIIDENGNIISEKTADKLQNKIIDKKIGDNKFKNKPPLITPKLSPKEYKALMQKDGNLEGYSLIKSSDDKLQIVIFRKLGDIHSPVGLIQLNSPADNIQDFLYKQISIYTVVCILVLVISITLGGSVIKRTLLPLYKMTNTVKAINIDALDKRISENNGQLEIDSLSKAFNNMLQRIENSFNKEKAIKRQMQQFISDASHELRTPLTSIRGFVEVLLRGAAKDEKKLDMALGSILSESERLTELVNELLMLTRLDQNVKIEIEKENMKSIIEEVYPQLHILGGNRKIELILKDNMYFLGNKNNIKQVIFNIVQNSINHTDENSGVISISLYDEAISNENFITLKIADNGTGISIEHQNKIFNRFFRSETHRARNHGGYGLGLSIVKSIIDKHGGEIKLESVPEKGTTIYIYLNKVI